MSEKALEIKCTRCGHVNVINSISALNLGAAKRCEVCDAALDPAKKMVLK